MTVTVSSTAATRIWIVSLSVRPAVRTTFVRTVLNPARVIRTSYSPGRSLTTENSPRPPVRTVRFSGPVSSIVTPGRTAPLPSVTTPLMAPKSTCAARSGTTNATTTIEAQMRVRMALPPRQVLSSIRIGEWREAHRKARAYVYPDCGFRHRTVASGRCRRSTARWIRDHICLDCETVSGSRGTLLCKRDRLSRLVCSPAHIGFHCQRHSGRPRGPEYGGERSVWVMKGQSGTSNWFTLYDVSTSGTSALLTARADRC